MHFFRSREDADQWAEGRDDVVILTLAEGDALAQYHWVERDRRLTSSAAG
jgi:hypothetical protein